MRVCGAAASCNRPLDCPRERGFQERRHTSLKATSSTVPCANAHAQPPTKPRGFETPRHSIPRQIRQVFHLKVKSVLITTRLSLDSPHVRNHIARRTASGDGWTVGMAVISAGKHLGYRPTRDVHIPLGRQVLPLLVPTTSSARPLSILTDAKHPGV